MTHAAQNMCGRRSSAARIFYPAKCAWWFEIRYPHLSKRPNVKTAFLPPDHFLRANSAEKCAKNVVHLKKRTKYVILIAEQILLADIAGVPAAGNEAHCVDGDGRESAGSKKIEGGNT